MVSVKESLKYGIRAIPKAGRLIDGVRRRIVVGNRVFLTIDDGPLESFSAILDQLDVYGAKATFFLVGSLINETNIPLIQTALLNGHKIGNHSWSHPAFSEITELDVEEEIVRTHQVIDQILHDIEGKGVQKPEERYFRFPYLNPGVRFRAKQVVTGHPSKREFAYNLLETLKYRIAGVDIESKDWAIESGKSTVEYSVGRILEANRGDVILMHDRACAPNILELTLPKLTERWRLAPLSDRAGLPVR